MVTMSRLKVCSRITPNEGNLTNRWVAAFVGLTWRVLYDTGEEKEFIVYNANFAFLNFHKPY